MTELQVPHSVEVEEQLLGVLIANGEQFALVRGVITPDDFFIVRYGCLFDAMQRIDQRGQTVDYVTVQDEMRASGKLDEFGGPAQITRLLLPSYAINGAADKYAKTVSELAARRRGLAAASEIARLMHDRNTDFGAVSDMATAALLQALQVYQASSLVTVADAASTNYDAIELKRRENITGMPSGYMDLDNLLGGLQNGDLVIVAGRPGMGKTSWLLSLALHLMETGNGVPALFSLEMTNEQVAQRLTAMDKTVTVTVKDQRTPATMSDKKWSEFVAASGRVSQLRGVLHDTGGITPEQLRGKARVAVAKHGANLIMVDYLQLMQAPQYAGNRTQEVGHIAHELKNLAKELRVPVIAAAQLNRGVENRQEKRPQMSDLRESGDIENDADVIMFLYRDEYYNENSAFKSQVEVILSKHRHGPTGKVSLYFDAERMRVCNLARKAVDVSD